MRSERSLHAYSIGAEVSRAGGAAAQFALAAWLLGPSNFGIFSLVIALSSLLSPITTLGCNNWIQPYLRGTRDISGVLSHLSLFGLCTGALAGLLLATVAGHWTELSIVSILPLCLSEMTVYTVWNIINLAFLAQERGAAYLAMVSSMSMSRALAVLVVGEIGRVTPGRLGLAFLIGGLLGLSWQVLLLRGGLRFSLTATRRNFRNGFHYSLVAMSSSAIDQFDKVLTLGMLGSQGFGVYSAASRISGYSLVPARGMAQVYYPQYFAAVRRDASGEIRLLVRKASGLGGLAALATGGLLSAGAAFASVHFLPSYSGIGWMVALLIPRMILRPLSYAYGDLLYAFDRPYLRLLAMLGAATVYGAALYLLPAQWGVPGVAMIGLIVEGATVLVFRKIALIQMTARRSLQSDGG